MTDLYIEDFRTYDEILDFVQQKSVSIPSHLISSHLNALIAVWRLL